MAQERNDLENIDRIDPSESTLRSIRDDKLNREDNAGTTARRDGKYELSSNADNVLDIPETGNIKHQIVETRQQMGETIEAIQEKLSYNNVSEQVSDHIHNAVETAKEAVYDATIGKAATFMKNIGDGISNTTIVKTAMDNPFPFLLIGAGAGLLAYQSFSGKQRGSQERSMGSFRTPAADSTFDTAGSKVRGAADKVSNAVGSALDTVSGAVGSVYAGTSDAAGKAYDKVGDFGTAAQEKYNYHINENPLAVGAVALAFGAAVGFAIPSTSYEGQLLGEARQQLMDKAQDAASGLIDSTKEVISETGHAVTDKANAAMQAIGSEHKQENSPF